MCYQCFEICGYILTCCYYNICKNDVKVYPIDDKPQKIEMT